MVFHFRFRCSCISVAVTLSPLHFCVKYATAWLSVATPPPPLAHAFQSTINVVKSLVKYAKTFQFPSTLGNKNDEVPDEFLKVQLALHRELFLIAKVAPGITLLYYKSSELSIIYLLCLESRQYEFA